MRKAITTLLSFLLCSCLIAQPRRVDIGKRIKRRRGDLLARCVLAEKAGVDPAKIEAIIRDVIQPKGRPRAWEMLRLLDEADRKLSTLFPPERERAFLLQMLEAAREAEIFFFPQCHIDLLWQWCWEETVEVAIKTFREKIELMRRMPEFCYCQDQAALYAAVEQADPNLFEEIRRAVREGRWHLVGGNWAETVMEQCTEEAVVRNFLHGKLYFREKFGVDVKTAWQMEGTGMPATLPQVLRGFGFEGAVFGREEPWTDLWRPVMLWRGCDGSEIPVVGLLHYGLPAFALARKAVEAVIVNWPKRPSRLAFVFGGGDHGGGANAKMLRSLSISARRAGLRAHVSGPDEFFRGLNKKELPVIEGSLRLGGVGVVTQHRLKRLLRECEHLLLALEAARCMLALSGVDNGATKEVADLATLWRNLLVCQFHDVLWGSTSYAPYEQALGWLRNLRATAHKALAEALSRMAREIGTKGEGIPVVVFNLLPWERSGLVRLTIESSKLPQGELVAVDDEGRLRPVRRAKDGVAFVAQKVPAFGYKVCWLREGKAEGGANVAVGERSIVLENDFLRVEVDKASGRVVALSRKGEGLDIRFPQGGFGLEVWRDGGSAWGSALRERIWDDSQSRAEVRVTERGPAVVAVASRFRFSEGGWVEREVRLWEGLPWVECVVRGDWRAPRAQLLATFDTGDESLKPFTEAPFGFVDWTKEVERRLKQGGVVGRLKARRKFMSEVARQLGYEVPQLRWADVCDEARGLAVLNEGKFGVRLGEGRIVLPLLRSPPFVRQEAWVIHRQPPNVPQFNDLGPFEVRFALLLHSGDWVGANLPRRGREFNLPLVGIVAPPSEGRLGPKASFLSLGGDVCFSCLKPAEDGSGDLVLRLYEPFGRQVRLRLTFSRAPSRVERANLMEEGIEPLSAGRSIALSLRPFQILTLRLGL